MFFAFGDGGDGGADVGTRNVRQEVLRSLLDVVPQYISDQCLIPLVAGKSFKPFLKFFFEADAGDFHVGGGNSGEGLHGNESP